MATGTIKWEANWTTIDAAMVLTEGVKTTDLSDEVDAGDHIHALLSIDADYSNDVLATTGLSVTILHDVNGTDYETEQGASTKIAIPFTQNGREAKVIRLSVGEFEKFKIQLDWGNTTAGSIVTVATMIKYADMDIT